jgi:hypothetical protein
MTAAQTSPFPSGGNKGCAYEYRPLEITKQQIRLLRRHTSRDQGLKRKQNTEAHGSDDTQTVLEYDLCTFNSDEAPAYKALSYVWGEALPLHEIRVNESILFVRQNLRNFLLLWDESDYIWIDQICINQRDLKERGQQVGMMAQIYERCESLIIWLGSESPGFRSAVDGYNDALSDLASRQLSLRRKLDARRPPLLELGEQWKRRLLTALFSDVYFTRLWVIQEVLLSQNIDVLYRSKRGLELISWKALGSYAPTAGLIMGIGSVLLHYHGASEEWWSLTRCLDKFSDCHCLEPRDKIYALLGLVPEGDKIPVDYTKPVHETFIDAVKILHKRHLPLRKGGEPCATILLKLAKNMGLDIKGKASLCFWRFLNNLFDCPANAVKEIGVDVVVQEPSSSEQVSAWWYETIVRKVVYTCREGPSQEQS